MGSGGRPGLLPLLGHQRDPADFALVSELAAGSAAVCAAVRRPLRGLLSDSPAAPPALRALFAPAWLRSAAFPGPPLRWNLLARLPSPGGRSPALRPQP